jgi:hypothetical protein
MRVLYNDQGDTMRIKYMLLKLSVTSVLGAALLAGACSEQSTQPEMISAPSEAGFSKGGKDAQQVKLTVAAPMHVTAEIGRQGGLLQAEHYFLSVPAGAVKHPTQFTMDVGTDGVVTLLATVTSRNGSVSDVGALGFREPVTLAMYYGYSEKLVEDPTGLQVAWLKDDGKLSTVPSKLYEEYQLVYGQLSHFSQYALASTRDEESAF